jgi:hypothetical protein
MNVEMGLRPHSFFSGNIFVPIFGTVSLQHIWNDVPADLSRTVQNW